MWSWHLWFAHNDVLDIICVLNHNFQRYYFTKQTLGQVYRKWEGAPYERPRVVRLKVEQTIGDGSGKRYAYIDTRQKPPRSVKEIISTLYQFGRKDAMPGIEEIADGTYIPNGGNNVSFKNCIQHPDTYYSGNKWHINPPEGFAYMNLWSMDNIKRSTYEEVDYTDTVVVKTIYDPCPVGYHLPTANAFTGFSLTGRHTQGVVGPTYTLFSNGKWEAPGWYFHTIPYPGPVDIEQGRTIIFFPLVGYRWKYGGKVQRVGEAADYWAAIPENRGAGTALSLTPVSIWPLDRDYKDDANAIRPIAE